MIEITDGRPGWIHIESRLIRMIVKTWYCLAGIVSLARLIVWLRYMEKDL